MRISTVILATVFALFTFFGSSLNEAQAAKKPKYKVVTITNGGKITGKVTWTGAKPKLADFPINKNPEICDTEKTGKRAFNRLLISKSGGVKNAVVYLSKVKEGKAMPKGPFLLDQRNCDYHPHVLLIPKGKKVTLKSSDDVLHNIHMFGKAKYNLPFPKKVSLKKKMKKAGEVRIQCDAGHGWMNAHIRVMSHPYYAITDSNGSFTLDNVPPGKYTIRMWHEHWVIKKTTKKKGKVASYFYNKPVRQKQSVDVAAGGTAVVSFVMNIK